MNNIYFPGEAFEQQFAQQSLADDNAGYEVEEMAEGEEEGANESMTLEQAQHLLLLHQQMQQ